ncbi:hypothetical protein BDQ17DRAFT_1439002 [Cyathus striatus]|nr:hypothetical protein BDQ17DRAFT_1439002 [Cyathus striatus]
MKQFLWNYTNIHSPFYGKWMAASLDTANALKHGCWFSRRLRKWSSAFIVDHNNIPENIYGKWNKSWLDDEDMKNELAEYIMSLGKFFSAMDLKNYLDTPEVQVQYGMKKGICEKTAQNWLKKMGYRWHREPTGQYVDGHECEDVRVYRQKYGWLQSPDGRESVHVIFRAGKNHDGYFANDKIIMQVNKAMDIVSRDYPEEEHIFVFDNATTHLKCADGALSARRMTKGPSKIFGVDVPLQINGVTQYHADGKVKKT